MALASSARRVMVLPRRRKVMDTMTPPYDTLFTQASKVLGGECKYLVSCGFNFADEHINQQLRGNRDGEVIRRLGEGVGGNLAWIGSSGC